MDPHQPPWEVLIDDQDRVVPSRPAPTDGPVSWSSGPLSSAVARYRVIQRADGSLDLAAVEYFDDYYPQELRPAELWDDQDERIHAGAPAPASVPSPAVAAAAAQDQDIPVIIPVLVGHGQAPRPAGMDPARHTLENRLHADDPPPATAVPAAATPAPTTAATGDPPVLWDYQTGESASEFRRRRQRQRRMTSAAPASPQPAAREPGAASAPSRRQRSPPTPASEAEPQA